VSGRPGRARAPLPGVLDGVRAFATLGGTAATRARSVGLVLFALPVFLLAVVGVALRGYTTPALVVGVLDESGGDAARSLVAALESDPQLRVRSYLDEEAMRLAAYRGRLNGGLVLPRGFPASGELRLYASQAGAGGPVLQALLDAALARRAQPGAPSSRVEVVDGDRLGAPPVGYQYTAPSNLVLFVIVNAVMSSAGIVALRRTGLGRRLLATPLRRSALVLGLGVGPGQLMAVQALFLLAIGALAFDVHWGSAAGVALVTGALVLVGVALTFFLGTLFRTESQATTFGPFLGILLGMLGGCMWPLEIVPRPVALAGHLAPTAWAMDAYLALSFGRAPWTAVLGDVGVLCAMAALLAGLGVARLQRQLSG
jgi:linearmycin/streptolysin S transport system permease protein